MADNDFAVLIIFIPNDWSSNWVADIEKAGDGELDTLRASRLPIILSIFPRLTFNVKIVRGHQLPSGHVSPPAIPW